MDRQYIWTSWWSAARRASGSEAPVRRMADQGVAGSRSGPIPISVSYPRLSVMGGEIIDAARAPQARFLIRPRGGSFFETAQGLTAPGTSLIVRRFPSGGHRSGRAESVGLFKASKGLGC